MGGPAPAAWPPAAPRRKATGSGRGATDAAAALALRAAAALRAAGALRAARAGGLRGRLLAATAAAGAGTWGAVAGELLGEVHGRGPWVASTTGCLRCPHCRRCRGGRPAPSDEPSARMRERSCRSTERSHLWAHGPSMQAFSAPDAGGGRSRRRLPPAAATIPRWPWSIPPMVAACARAAGSRCRTAPAAPRRPHRAVTASCVSAASARSEAARP